MLRKRVQPLQGVTEIVKERLCHAAGSRTVHDGSDDVEAGSVNERGDDVERKTGARMQRRVVEQADTAVIRRRRRVVFAYLKPGGAQAISCGL